MVDVADVPVWLILQGNIGHALAGQQHGWHHTVCGTFTPNGVTRKRRPKRICRKCVANLKHVTLAARDSWRISRA
jgi:hypothetical protein